MKIFYITPLLLACWGLAVDASAQNAGAKTSKPAAKPAKQRQAAPANSVSRTEIRSTATQMAAGIAAAEAALEPAELAIAESVHTGVMPCEMGTSVTLASDPAAPGYFNMHGKNFRFRMVPVITVTGAIRLEDRQAGAVWLQLPNKSMLMNQKIGQRMADGCMSQSQLVVAQGMKDAPPPDLLGPPAAGSVTTTRP
jgi:hypothetical protein